MVRFFQAYNSEVEKAKKRRTERETRTGVGDEEPEREILKKC